MSIRILFSILLPATTVLLAQVKVLTVSPQGATEELGEVKVVFDRPVAAPGAEVPKNLFRLDPPVPGSLRWAGSDTLAFVPRGRWPLSTRFRATLAELTAVDGAKLEGGHEWDFESPRPRLVDSSPSFGESGISPWANFVLTFSQEVAVKGSIRFLDLTAGEVERRRGKGPGREVLGANPTWEAVWNGWQKLRGEWNGKRIPFRVGYGHSNEREIQRWKSFGARFGDPKPEIGGIDRRILVLEPLESLPRGMNVTVAIAEGIKPLEGDLPAVEGGGACEVLPDFAPVSGPSASEDPEQPSPLRFTTPVSWQAMARHVFVQELDPKDPSKSLRTIFHPRLKAGDLPTWSSPSLSLSDFPLEPNRSYRVIVVKGASNESGDALPETCAFDFSTANLRAFVSASRGQALMESYRPSRFPVTFRNLRGVSFASVSVSPEEIHRYRQDFYAEKPLLRESQQDFEVDGNRTATKFFDLPLGGGEGFVYYEVRPGRVVPGTPKSWISSNLRGLLQVSSIALGVKSSFHQILAVVCDLSNASRLAGAEVSLHDGRTGEIVGKATTGADGTAELPGWSRVGSSEGFYVTALFKGRRAYTDGSFSKDLETWNFGVRSDTWSSPDEDLTYLTTDRGVYRGGETVHVKGFSRTLTNEELRAPDAREGLLSLVDREGKVVASNAVTLSAFGGFDASFPLVADASPGDWQVRFERKGHQRSLGLLVAYFKAPLFRVSAAGKPGVRIAGENEIFRVKADYLFGAPVAGAKASWSLTPSAVEGNWRPPFSLAGENAEDWIFDLDALTLEDQSAFYTEERWSRRLRGLPQRSAGTASLSADGTLEQAARLDAGGVPVPVVWNFEAEVEDASKAAVAARTVVTAHPSSVAVGLKRTRPLVDATVPFETSVIALTPAGDVVPGTAIALSLVQRDWVQAKRREVGGWSTESQPVDRVVFATNVVSVAGPLRLNLPLARGGYFLLRGEARDGAGRRSLAAFDFYAYGSGGAWWKAEDDDRVEMRAERSTLAPGDVAKIVVKSPWAVADALVTVERGRVLEKFWTTLSTANSVIRVPIRREWIPNVYVSVTLMKGRQGDAVAKDGTDLGVPAVKIGYVGLSVVPDSARLGVTVDLGVRKAEPRQTIPVSVRTLDAAGKGRSSEVALFAVDEAVVNLTGFRPPDPLAFFYQPRSLAVATLDNRPYVLRQRVFGQKGEEPGGGGGEGEAPSSPFRSDFKVTPFWTGALVTGDDGKADTSFVLPDNLTTFRLFAVAASRASFGSGEASLTVRKDFMMIPAFPRFALPGDVVDAGVVVFNLSTESGRVTLSPDLAGPGGFDKKAVEFDLPAGRSTNVRFRLRPTSPGDLVFGVLGKFQGSTLRKEDGLRWILPVRAPILLDSARATGFLRGENETRVEEIRVPELALPDQGGLRLTVSSSRLAELGLPLSYLLDYPYGCVEQTSSRLWAALVRLRFAGAFESRSTALSPEVVRTNLNYLATFQREDGGLSFWPGGRESYPWGTAWALLVLAEAKAQGFDPGETMMRRAMSYLQNQVNGTGEGPRGAAFTASSRAFFALAILKNGGDPGSIWDGLESSLPEMSVFARAAFLEALALRRKTADSARLAILSRKVRQSLLNACVIESETARVKELRYEGSRWLLDSEARSQAAVLTALLADDPGEPLAPRFLEGLVRGRTEGRWSSTQDNAWAVRAFLSYLSAFEKDAPRYAAELTLGSRNLLAVSSAKREDRFQSDVPMADLTGLLENRAGKLAVKKTGPGTMYYQARLGLALPANAVSARSRGFTIGRRYLHPETGKELASFRAGDLVKVVLTVETAEPRSFVAVEDPVPAGFEILDERLAITTRRSVEMNAETGSWFGRGWSHRELRDHRLAVFADELASGTSVYTYAIRATTPGVFQAGPPRVEQMYEPEVNGIGNGASVRVDE